MHNLMSSRTYQTSTIKSYFSRQMPPRRKQPVASSSAQKPPAKRRSKLAKEHDITADQEAEIQEAFALFATNERKKNGQISVHDVRRCLVALNAAPASADELRQLVEVADQDGTGWVDYDQFLPVAAISLNRASTKDDDEVNEEVEKAYALFTKGEDRAITLQDLRRVAKELREDVPENVLKDMVREATGGGLGGVERDDFEGVMRRAGVFS